MSCDFLANDNCLAKLITRHGLINRNLHPTFLDNIFPDAIGFLLDHNLRLMGEPGVGKNLLARITAMLFSRYHGGHCDTDTFALQETSISSVACTPISLLLLLR